MARTFDRASIVITDANEFFGDLHDRMPVILEPQRNDTHVPFQPPLDRHNPRAFPEAQRCRR
jgi:putative SOS response-associated peptidase YedK